MLFGLLRIFVERPDRFLVLNSVRPLSRCPIVIQIIRILKHGFLCLILEVTNIVKFHVRLLQRGVREDAVEFRMIDIATGRLSDPSEVQVLLDIKTPKSITALLTNLPLVIGDGSPSHPGLLPASHV